MSACIPGGWMICGQPRWTDWSAPEPGTSLPESLPASCSHVHGLARRTSRKKDENSHLFFFFSFLQQNTSKQPSEIDNIILAVNVSPPHRMKLWAASLCPHIHTNPSYATCPARNGSEPKLLQHLAEVSVIMLSNQDIFLERNVAVEFFQMLCFFKFNHSFSDLGVTAGFRLCTQT